MKRQESIHPRSYYTDGVKKNTCKPRSKERARRVAAAIEKHLEQHPLDDMSRSHLSKLKQFIGS